MCETWRTIPGWNDYEINRDGTVRRKSSGFILQPSAAGQVRLARSRRQRSWRNVKRLLYEVFPELRPTKAVRIPVTERRPHPWEDEVFKPYNDDYLVSNAGRVWSKRVGRCVKSIRLGTKEVSAQRAAEEMFGYNILTLPGEEWQRSLLFPGYAFSSEGRVWSDSHRKIMHFPKTASKKYLRFKDRKGNQVVLHRIIASLFVPNPDNLPCVDHINEDRYDNRAANLRWCTAEQNREYYANNHYR